MQLFPLLVSRAAPAATDSHCLLQRFNTLRNMPCRLDLKSDCYLPSRPFLSRQEKCNRPPGMPCGNWFSNCSREFTLTGRNYQEGHMKQVYYDEGWSGPNKYTFEVYQLENGTFRALARKWNGKINKVQQETQFLSDTREGLKHQDYPRTRQVKIFLNSDFWEKGND
ncbi:hypothetical protein [Photorhabdus sp. RM71S]|uniref:hypothetical protein n=1 Tax=Photorhabdus sp. RM71S TaxID=3342824 RepID=UPI0036DE9CC8